MRGQGPTGGAMTRAELIEELSMMAAGVAPGDESALMSSLEMCREFVGADAMSVWRLIDSSTFKLVAAEAGGESYLREDASVKADPDRLDVLFEVGNLVVSRADFAPSFEPVHPSAARTLVFAVGGRQSGGVVGFTTHSARHWTDHDIEDASHLASLVFAVAQRLQADTEALRTHALLDLVTRISLTASASTLNTVEQARVDMLGMLGDFFDSADASLWTYSAGELSLEHGVAARALRSQSGETIPMSEEEADGLASVGHVLRRIGNIRGDTEVPFPDDRVVLSVAVGDSASAFGLLAITPPENRRWSDEEIAAMRSIGQVFTQMNSRIFAEKEVRRRLDLEALVARLTTAAIDISPDTINGVLETLLRSLIEFFDLEQAAVWRFEGDHAFCRMSLSPDGHREIEGRNAPLPDLEKLRERGWVITRMSSLADSVGLDPGNSGASRALVTAYRSSEGILGSLVLVAAGDRTWSIDEIKTARTAADLLSQIRARIVIDRRLVRRRSIDAMILGVSRRLLEATIDDVLGVLDEVLLDIRGHFGLGSVAIWNADRNSGVLRCFSEAMAEDITPVASMSPLPPDHDVVGALVQGGDTFEMSLSQTNDEPRDSEVVTVIPIVVEPDDLLFLSLIPDDSGVVDEDMVDGLRTICGLFAQLRHRLNVERLVDLRRRADQAIKEVASKFLEGAVGEQDDAIDDALARLGTLLDADAIALWRTDDEAGVNRRTNVWRSSPDTVLIGDAVVEIPVDHPWSITAASDTAAREVDFPAPGAPDRFRIIAPLRRERPMIGALVATFDSRMRSRAEAEVAVSLLDSTALVLAQLGRRADAESTLVRKLAIDKVLRELSNRLVRSTATDFEDSINCLREVLAQSEVDHLSYWRISLDGDDAEVELVAEFATGGVREIPPAYGRTSWNGSEYQTWLTGLDEIEQWDLADSPTGIRAVFSEVAVPGDRCVAAIREVIDDDHILYLVVSRSGIHKFDSLELDMFLSVASMLAEHETRVTAELWFSAAFDHSPTAISLRDDELKLIGCNPAYEKLTGRPQAELKGTDLYATLEPEIAAAHMTRSGSGEDSQQPPDELRYIRPDGTIVWGRLVFTPVQLPGRREPFRLTYVEDITSSRRHRELLVHQATHDELTSLPNRRMFLRTANEWLESDRDIAVLVLDLDRFKVVNDSLGHSTGDQLLITCADRIRLSLRPGDRVYRLGGDEFAILLSSPADMTRAAAVADRMLSLLREPAHIGGVDVFPSASIGIALPDADDAIDDLLRHADVAMYQSKAKGRDRWTGFDDSMRASVLERIRTETDLRLAIDNGQLEVHYQPEIMLDSGAIVGAEALVRWHHPELGLLTAGSFIDVAEESGIVVDLGRWVLGVATKQAARWIEDGSDIIIRVNLSARQLRSELINEVESALESAALAPDRLCLELTETAIMDDVEESELLLAKLSAIGVQLAIDDFGTGFSSLAYLKRLPVNILKIDRSFVDGVGVDPDDTSIVESVITLAKTLNLEVVAEGIEDASQVRELLRLGCVRGQGFHLARPAAADDVELLLARDRQS